MRYNSGLEWDTITRQSELEIPGVLLPFLLQIKTFNEGKDKPLLLFFLVQVQGVENMVLIGESSVESSQIQGSDNS